MQQGSFCYCRLFRLLVYETTVTVWLVEEKMVAGLDADDNVRWPNNTYGFMYYEESSSSYEFFNQEVVDRAYIKQKCSKTPGGG